MCMAFLSSGNNPVSRQPAKGEADGGPDGLSDRRVPGSTLYSRHRKHALEPNVQMYRRFATECLGCFDCTNDDSKRQLFLEMARTWHPLPKTIKQSAVCAAIWPGRYQFIKTADVSGRDHPASRA